jgi:F-type H+-transporting ATPase subunit delta
MRGPSRAALTEARHQLSEAVTSAAVARTLGGELFAILGVLDEEAGLRRALSDSSRRAQARAELASRLFGDQVSEATLRLFTSMCESRW